MYSLKELYKIGNGPSSSHTMGPYYAVLEFLKRYPSCDEVEVVLYGSLALTGKGHLTDVVIQKTFSPIPCRISFDSLTEVRHPNTMDMHGFFQGKPIGNLRVYSIGGGAIETEGEKKVLSQDVYPHSSLKSIIKYCQQRQFGLAEYVDQMEPMIHRYLSQVCDQMQQTVEQGLAKEGFLPGKLKITRKAKHIYEQIHPSASEDEQFRQRLVAYAYAVSEENASGEKVVTAPTCGSAGVMSAIVYATLQSSKYSRKQVIDGLKVAGLFGNLIKENGSISGAEAGCQAEVGSACSMGAAFLAYIHGASMQRIESAAEIALEHHLGLTCDPIDGYVQIPCIERNAVAVLRALDAANLAFYLNNEDSKISFDLVVETMLDTGKDLSQRYKETSQGGLAKKYH